MHVLSNPIRCFCVLILATLLASCASTVNAPTGAEAYKIMPAAREDDSVLDYEIGPLDKISVRVFQEPDLSVDQLQVDAAGNIFFPLIGQVREIGRAHV